MIALHSVTKELGSGSNRTVVLDDIDWTIPRGAQLAILAQRGSGATTLLEIISGAQIPTKGWVERRAVVSLTSGLVRYGSGRMTARHLIGRLASLYHADPKELGTFVEQFANLQDLVDVPIGLLARSMRQKLNMGLFYGLPCDYYLFDGRINVGAGDLKQKCDVAFSRRRDQSGMILATFLPKVARQFGGTGGVLHRGKIYIFDRLEDAIEAYEQLLIEDPIVVQPRPRNMPPPGVEDIEEF